MIIKEFYTQRSDGVNLYRTYSSTNMMIRQIETGIEYNEAIDVENTTYTYEETDTPIIQDPLEAQEILNIIMGEE